MEICEQEIARMMNTCTGSQVMVAPVIRVRGGEGNKWWGEGLTRKRKPKRYQGFGQLENEAHHQ